jgi:C-terminal processing protease CtpA/Prc
MTGRYSIILAFIVLSGWAGVSYAAGNVWYGFGGKTEMTGFNPLNQTLRTLFVSNVEPGSPAAEKGLRDGDQIMEVQGVPVMGIKASALEAAMPKQSGKPLQLKIKRGEGDIISVTLIGVAKPKGG